MFAAGCEHQQRLRQWVHGLVKHQLAQFFRQWRAAWLTGQHHRPARLAKEFGHAGDVRGLARTVNAFKTDECAVCHERLELIVDCRRWR